MQSNNHFDDNVFFNERDYWARNKDMNNVFECLC